jgi:hypothetical protein
MLRRASVALAKSNSRSSARFYSSHKEIAFGNDGRQALARGVEILAKAVAVTLGPKGRNVIIGMICLPPLCPSLCPSISLYAIFRGMQDFHG